MPRTIQFARNQAQQEFLGRGPVIGVGIAGEEGDKLLFLLRDNSPAAKDEILAWAEERRVEVTFQVADPRPVRV